MSKLRSLGGAGVLKHDARTQSVDFGTWQGIVEHSTRKNDRTSDFSILDAPKC